MHDNQTADNLQDFYGQAGYLLCEMLSVEQYNLTSYQFGTFGDVLVRDGFMTADESGAYRLTDAGRLLARAWDAAQENRYKREDKQALADEASEIAREAENG